MGSRGGRRRAGGSPAEEARGSFAGEGLLGPSGEGAWGARGHRGAGEPTGSGGRRDRAVFQDARGLHRPFRDTRRSPRHRPRHPDTHGTAGNRGTLAASTLCSRLNDTPEPLGAETLATFLLRAPDTAGNGGTVAASTLRSRLNDTPEPLRAGRRWPRHRPGSNWTPRGLQQGPDRSSFGSRASGALEPCLIVRCPFDDQSPCKAGGLARSSRP